MERIFQDFKQSFLAISEISLKMLCKDSKKRLTDRPQPCNKTSGEKVFRDGLDKINKQSSKTGIVSKCLLNAFPQKFAFFRYIHFILGDVGPENLFVDDLDGILGVF